MGRFKKKQRIVLAPRRDHRTVCLYQSTRPPKPNQNQHTLPSAGPCKVRNTGSRTVTKCGPEPELLVLTAADQGGGHTQSRAEDRTHSCCCTLLPLPPSGAPVSLASFFLGHLRGCAPPRPASCSLSCPCPAGAPLGAPQSLRQVGESWEWCGRVGPGPANIANIAVWGACSGRIWGRKAVGARERGLGDSAINAP